MESPLFRYFKGAPVEPVQFKPKPKVVSIPVHFVGGSEKNPARSKSSSAVKIQKVFRRFLVRKSVKKIASVKREVEEIERRISQNDAVDLIRRENSKERLRLNEMLMALLFKLDSVRGVDSGVRELRKAVIRKAIALQERIDDIAAGDHKPLEMIEDLDGSGNGEIEGNNTNRTPSLRDAEPYGKEEADVVHNRGFPGEGGDESGEVHFLAEEEAISESMGNHQVEADVVNNCGLAIKAGDESGEVNCLDEEDAISEIMDDQKMDIDLGDASNGSERKPFVENFGDSDNTENRTPLLEVGETDDKQEANDLDDNDLLGKIHDESGMIHCPRIAEAISESMDEEKMDFAEVEVGFEVKEDEEGCIVKQIVEVDPLPTSEYVEGCEKTDSHASNGIGDQNISEKQNELLERMMEENEKMMSLMTQLYEKNEVQTQMLSSLSHRVEQLERALICERLRKKKKRHAAGTVDCSESIQDQKKCGKR